MQNGVSETTLINLINRKAERSGNVANVFFLNLSLLSFLLLSYIKWIHLFMKINHAVV